MNIGYAVTLTDDLVAALPEPDQPTDLIKHPGIEWNRHMPRLIYNFEDWAGDFHELFSPPAPEDLRVQIFDFGSAHSPHHPEPSPSPRPSWWYLNHSAPEICLGKEDPNFALSVDIWNLAQLLFHLEFGETLFSGFMVQFTGDFVRQLEYISEGLADLPERWRPFAEEAIAKTPTSRYADEPEDRKWLHTQCRCQALELGEHGEYRDFDAGPKTEAGKTAMKEHNVEFWKFFRRASALDPDKRPSAHDLLDEPYLNRWRLASKKQTGEILDPQPAPSPESST